MKNKSIKEGNRITLVFWDGCLNEHTGILKKDENDELYILISRGVVGYVKDACEVKEVE